MNFITIKDELKQFCIIETHRRINNLKVAIDTAQQEANAHKGAMASRYDTFKEEAQYLRGGYEKQLKEALEDLALLKQIELKYNQRIELGAVVETVETTGDGNISQNSYFISMSLPVDPLLKHGKRYHCISYSSPIILAMRNCEEGEELNFRGRRIEIVQIW